MQLELFSSEKTIDMMDPKMTWLRGLKYDMRRRWYETDEAHKRRMLLTASALQTNYYASQWVNFESLFEICPIGQSNRLPQDKKTLGSHICHFLQMKDIRPEDWQVPTKLSSTISSELPARAVFKAKTHDIFLSRFKEPIGKCVIYLGKPEPLYVSSNFFLLRTRANFSPWLALGLLKSSFINAQIHLLLSLHPKAVITEIYQREIKHIKLPILPSDVQYIIESLVSQRLMPIHDLPLKMDVSFGSSTIMNGSYCRWLSICDQEIDNIILKHVGS